MIRYFIIFLWKLVYTQTWVMNGIFEAKTGFIESAHPYRNSQHALWKIIAPRGGKLWFRFHNLEIEVDRANGRCVNDALTIYEEDESKNQKSLFGTPPICGYLGNSTYAKTFKRENIVPKPFFNVEQQGLRLALKLSSK